eukprot:653457-Pleurochrysis_carterae.AAC.1
MAAPATTPPAAAPSAAGPEATAASPEAGGRAQGAGAAEATSTASARGQHTADERATAARLQLSSVPSLEASSINAGIGRPGAPPGAVQTFNYLCALRMPDARAKGALPCAWQALF